MENREYESFKERLRENQTIYIYGAGVVAYGAKRAVQELFGIRCRAYLVSDCKKNPEQIERIPVKAAGDIWENHISGEYILIATPEEYHQEIIESLKSYGCWNYDILTSHLEYCLMGEYLFETKGIRRIEDFGRTKSESETDKKNSRTDEWNSRLGNEESVREKGKPDICVHMAVSHRDQKLKKEYLESAWIKKVQAGAALTDQKISLCGDDIGQNISVQNALYGELTVTYWAWKNDLHDFMGLFHYRRILNVEEKQLLRLLTKEADVILPLPFVCCPDASGQYGRYLTETDQRILWEVLEEKRPEIYEKACKALKEPYLYNYNMLIARKAVFTDYCEWIFPLLDEMTRRCGKIEMERLPRYIGRAGEVFTSVYFLVNERGWKIVHGEKCWRI